MKFLYSLLFLTLLSPLFLHAQSNGTAPEKSGMYFFVGAGINNSTINYSGNDQLQNAKAFSSNSLQINLGTDIYFDKYSQALAFRMELGFNPGNKAQLETNYNDGITYSNNPTSYTEVFKFTQNIASFSPQIIWNVYNADVLKIYVDAGFSINYAMYSNKQFSKTTSYQSGDQYTVQQAFPQMHSVIFNVPVKAGVTIAHTVSIFAAYIPKTALNQNPGEAYNQSLYQAGIDYYFGKK